MKQDWTNLPPWHTVRKVPKPVKFHFYDKFNPVWWAENADEPVPPAWYLPGDKHRTLKWHFRNPFHNFDFYVVGVADRKFTRSGRYPERNANPHGGWDFAVLRRWTTLLPFVSYERPRVTFYIGWRESGAFGIELRIHHLKASKKNGNPGPNALDLNQSKSPASEPFPKPVTPTQPNK